MNIFDHLNNLTEKKSDLDLNDPEAVKSYEPYMVNRFISMVNCFIPLVNMINRFANVTKQSHYNYFLNTLPKSRQYFKYIKRKNEMSTEDQEKIMKYYQCGKREFNEYLMILTPEQIEEILKKFEEGKAKK